MIDKSGWGSCEEFTLICDHCEEEVEGFDEFDDAVKHKKENGWYSVKSASGRWYELCPDCSSDREIVEEYRNK